MFKSHVELNGAQVLGFGNTSPTQPLTKVKNGCELFKSVVEKYGQIEDKQELINEILLLLKNDTKSVNFILNLKALTDICFRDRLNFKK